MADSFVGTFALTEFKESLPVSRFICWISEAIRAMNPMFTTDDEKGE